MTRYRRSRLAAFQVLDGSAVVIVAPRRTVHRLNEVATRVWERLEGAPAFDELLGDLLDEFDVDEATLRADLQELLEKMRELELVDVEGGAPV